jgi:hypothetical protein
MVIDQNPQSDYQSAIADHHCQSTRLSQIYPKKAFGINWETGGDE